MKIVFNPDYRNLSCRDFNGVYQSFDTKKEFEKFLKSSQKVYKESYHSFSAIYKIMVVDTESLKFVVSPSAYHQMNRHVQEIRLQLERSLEKTDFPEIRLLKESLEESLTDYRNISNRYKIYSMKSNVIFITNFLKNHSL